MTRIGAIDVFCGAGGLTHGLQVAGVNVVAGIDLDPACRYPYERNNRAEFLLRDVSTVDPAELCELYLPGETRLLAGCAPCQPFSTYTQKRKGRGGDQRWRLLEAFTELVVGVQPDLITMENVPRLQRHQVYSRFTRRLRREGYLVSSHEVDCRLYGIPQTRKRLVILASRLGPIQLIPPTHKIEGCPTVRDTISALAPIEAGGHSASDRLHRSMRLSDLNLRRIRQSQPGGTWADWDEDLIANCHRKATGRRYSSVYGRMDWDSQAPTITTECYFYGSGRYGHPEQDRALSLREAALLQTFPKGYRFVPGSEPVRFKTVGRLIGNAVPVRLGRVIGRSLTRHIREVS